MKCSVCPAFSPHSPQSQKIDGKCTTCSRSWAVREFQFERLRLFLPSRLNANYILVHLCIAMENMIYLGCQEWHCLSLAMNNVMRLCSTTR